MLFGVNVDPLNHPPNAADLRALGANAVRLVLREDMAVLVSIHALAEAGIQVLGVLTAQSFSTRVGLEHYRGLPLTLIQLGNEPDHDGQASWTMGHADYRRFVEHVLPALRGWYPDVPIISAGLVSGQPSWWAPLSDLPFDGIAVHPYAKDAEEARALLRAYKRYGRRVYATEVNRPPAEIGAFVPMLDEETAGAWWMCWSDAQTAATEGIHLGLVDGDGQPKAEYLALKSALEEQAMFTPGEGIGSPEMRAYLEERAREAAMEFKDFVKSPELYYAPGLSTIMTAKGPVYYSTYTNEKIGPF